MENASVNRTLSALYNTNSVFCNNPVDVRVVHKWEARNHKKGMALMGHELLLLDKEATAAQAFIPARLIPQFSHLTAGEVYTIRRFMLKAAKTTYRVAEHKNIVVLTEQSTAVQNQPGENAIPLERLRLKLYEEFAAGVDTNIDLFDVLGEVMLITGLENGTGVGRDKKGVSLHLRLKDGQTMRVYLWDSFGDLIRQRWETQTKPSVLLLTTMSCRTVGGVASLGTTSSTRVFADTEISETKEFMDWLANGAVGRPIITGSSSAVTKIEHSTVDDLHQFLQDANPMVTNKLGLLNSQLAYNWIISTLSRV